MKNQSDSGRDRGGDPDHEQLELLPVAMVYCTLKLDQSRGWTSTFRIQSPDGKNVLATWGRAGGSLAHGVQKCLDDLNVAWQMATGVGPFDETAARMTPTAGDWRAHSVPLDSL